VGEKTIIDWLVDDLSTSGEIGSFVVVSNSRFYNFFKEWANNKNSDVPIEVLDDGTSSNETRLGAVKDIEFALENTKNSCNGDFLVMAADNVLDFSLNEFISYALKKNTSCVMRYYEESIEKLQKCGVLVLEEEKVVSMVEKPSAPPSHFACPPFYYYKREDLLHIKDAIKDGCGTDAPGSLVSWMCKHFELHSFLMPAPRHDIGNLQNYESMNNTYKGPFVKSV
ncbi:MAG: nucleotidyltransferase family protein, partial [Sphaerochaetaceae bacterium]|nr:nucleotidyltransferase family protein [Sphaerochaetaceae bacterium]